jgi:chromosome segregation ATPase
MSAAGLPDLIVRLEKFAAVLVGLEREVTDLHAAAKLLDLATAVPVPPPFLDEPDEELAKLRADLKRAREENERLEGELVSLRLFRDETKDKIRKAVAQVVDLRLDPNAEKAVRAIVVDRDRLQEEKAKVESDLARWKQEAQKRFGALKGDLEKIQKERDAIRAQKENLLRLLQERDAQEGSAEVTLEDITSSETFRTMLANIRKTSRQELTILHDAVASIRAIDPKAYETILEVVARAFKKAQVENPFATLPRE